MGHLISLDVFTLDKTEDFQMDDAGTKSFTSDEDLQNLMDSMGQELKFSKGRKAFQN